jgi:hypothetical protein
MLSEKNWKKLSRSPGAESCTRGYPKKGRAGKKVTEVKRQKNLEILRTLTDKRDGEIGRERRGSRQTKSAAFRLFYFSIPFLSLSPTNQVCVIAVGRTDGRHIVLKSHLQVFNF